MLLEVNTLLLVITHIFWTSATKQLTMSSASSNVCKTEPYQAACKAWHELIGTHRHLLS